MKFFSLTLSVLLIVLSVSCASDATSEDVGSIDAKPKQTTTEKTASYELTEALVRAKQNKDYRLLVTSGRSISVPGVKASDYQGVIALCGKKYSSGAGDVITSEEQRLARKKLVDFMQQYNKQMLAICQEKLTK